MMTWRTCVLVISVVLLDSTADADAERPLPPPTVQTCAAGALVDATFRDAALATLQRLVVHAPGQAAHGAIRSSLAPAHLDPHGEAWHHVSAYQVNMALAAALRVAPRMGPTVADWLRWQAQRTTPVADNAALVFDHWVRASDMQLATCPPGLALSACPQVDAYDSTAASLLLLADAYRSATGDTALLHEPAVRGALQDAVGTLGFLALPQGLTAAKPGYPVAHLMNAIETAAGWRSWARVQDAVYAEQVASQASLAAARRVEDAIREHLWHAPSRTWRVSLGAEPPVFSRWYPDTVAQAWPLLWGVGANGSAPSAVAQAAWRQAADHWRVGAHASQRHVDVDGYWGPMAAVAARCVGDDTTARAWVARARSTWLTGAQPFAWPFQVGDLRWLFWLSDPLAVAPTVTRTARASVP